MSEVETPAPSPFAALGLGKPLLDALAALGYEAPTPIQERTIPILLAGRDLIGQAQTGTGKTAAFALPILEKIDPKSTDTQALVLAPTRELAMQVADAIHTYSQKMGPISVLPVYGGAPIVHQLKRLDRGAHVVVGTPGRLIDHLDRGTLKLGNVKMIVLDEADEMLKMGFIEDIEKLLGAAPTPRQTALFSATMPDEVLRIARRYLDNPERVSIEHKAVNTPAIEQRFLNLSEGQKLDVLTTILELDESDAVLIFRRTKNGAAELAEKLIGRGFAAEAMHGDMNQAARENVIRRLRAGNVEIVVATDVAARGLDVEQISHVVNYDIPYDVEAYVHRIGRTGRAGRSGVATLFITPRERGMMRAIERYTGQQIKPMKMPTRADVAAHRVNQFKELMRKTLAEGDLDLYVELIEQLVDEGQHDAAEIAAAAAKIASGGRSLKPEPEVRDYVPPREFSGP
ncbi:MAG TPA: DEAD/DEAH box helicase, partial [Thermoanaerobaculia bacterium]